MNAVEGDVAQSVPRTMFGSGGWALVYSGIRGEAVIEVERGGDVVAAFVPKVGQTQECGV